MLLGILRVSSPRLRRPPVETRPPEPLRDSDRLDAATDQNRATKPQPLPPCLAPPRATPAPPSAARLSPPGSIAPYDIIVLLFATHIKHKSGTPIHDGALKAEVTFCVQGVISPLLANIYLHPLDRLMEESGYRMVRYADDFVILCRTAQEAEAALRRATAWVADNGLRLHPDKRRIGDCREPGQGFDFLGYRFEAGRRLVRQKSLRAFKDKVRAMTGRSRGASMRRIIDDLNPMLRGWFGYFKQAAPSIHRHLDGFIRRRLRAILRKQEKRPGFGRCPNDHQRWPNTFFADLGLFTLSTARYHARHPR